MSEDIEVLLRIGGKFFEGKLQPQKTGSQFPAPDAKRPMLPEVYAEMVAVTDEGSYWKIKPKEFLRKEDFAEIARIVRQYKGEYVSAGRSSYFKIPK
jgi:hypothetical protein